MATNKHSCAVNFQMVLSMAIIVFLIFIGYSISFDQNRHLINEKPLENTQQLENEKSATFDHILGFVIILGALEATLFIENKKLKQKYWEQELIAIKETYKKKQGGIRSVSSESSKLLSKKEEKQIILRKLQYDIIKSYSKTYLAMIAMKSVTLIAYIYEMLLSQLDWRNGNSNIDFILKFGQNDYMNLSCVLVAARLIELVNYFVIKRWLNNIKRDIVAQLKLDSNNLREHLNNMQNTEWGFSYNYPEEFNENQNNQGVDNEDVEKGPLLKQYVLQNESKSNGSSNTNSTNANSGKMSGSNANSNIQPQNQSSQSMPQPRLSNASMYSQSVAQATIIL